MPLIAPILDDRTYAQLKDELVKRIPVYAPEWTDHNESDPGIALLELFAFLGESLLFRFNQIPDATKVAFLRLLGVRPRPPQAARVLLTAETERPNGVQVLRGRVARAGAVAFETQDEVYVWPLEVRGVVRLPAANTADPAELDRRDAVLQAMSAPNGLLVQNSVVPADPLSPDAVPVDAGAAADESLWVALLATDKRLVATLPAALATRTLFVGVALDESTDPHPFALEPTQDRSPTGLAAPLQASRLTLDPPPLLWELWTGVTPRTPTGFATLGVPGDSTRGLTTTGVVTLSMPPSIPASVTVPAGLVDARSRPPTLDDPDVAARLVTWLRVRRPTGSADSLPRVAWVGINCVWAEHGETTAPELLGQGSGDPGQTYRLARPPVLPDTVQVEVETADGWEPWHEVDTLATSEADDRHVVVDHAAGLVTFGAGGRGAVPQLGQRIRVISYRSGGGTSGNVPAGAVTALSGVAGVKVTNPLAAAGGRDAASLVEALDEIPAAVHRRERAVTADDYRALALEVPGVARADVLPLFHPDTPIVEAAGVVSVVAFPTVDRRNPDAPEPDVSLLRRVAAYLNPRRTLTSELYVIPPTYQPIAVAVGVRVKQGYQVDAVRRWVELILRQYLAALPPLGPEGRGWPLGRSVHRPELEAVAVQVEGVEFLEDSIGLARFDTAGQTWEPVGRELTLRPWEMPRLAHITVVPGLPLPPGDGYAEPLPGDAILVELPPDVC